MDQELTRLFAGRDLLTEQVQKICLEAGLTLPINIGKVRPAMIIEKHKIVCMRCGDVSDKVSAQLQTEHYYCRSCIQLGRVTSNQELVAFPEKNQFEIQKSPLTWEGVLTPQQTLAAMRLQQAMEKNEQHLLWAVTGAGKTEMMFPGIAKALIDGKRVCIASPRVDVCIELFPRIAAAFKKTTSILLHGKSESVYVYSQIVVCTTHQLLRFKEAFDVLIIDEVDAFPFVNNRVLDFAAKKAVKKIGTVIYLTATPTTELKKEIRQRTLSISYLPRRYHGFDLPVPKYLYNAKYINSKGQPVLSNKLLKIFKQKKKVNQRFLVFVPEIAWLIPLKAILQQSLPALSVVTVHAADKERLAKVQAFRDGSGDCLLTTSILERGVTFKNIHVLILHADHRVFTTAALVQIAGRVGRHADYPTGEVLFCFSHYNKAMSNAIKEIKAMNKRKESN